MDTLHRFAGLVLLFALTVLVVSATAVTGPVQIIVHPGGGTVCLDTDCRMNQGTTDGTSSTVFENVEAGSYHMINVYGIEGYQPYLKQFFYDPSGAKVTRDIVLEPVKSAPVGTGAIQVFITPDGGQACVDKICEKSSGTSSGTWSVQFTVTANTYHTLTLTHEGYTPYTKQIRVLPGQTSTLNIELKPLPPGVPSGPAQTPVSAISQPPQPTTANLPGMLAFIAIGICGLALAGKKSR
jgi:hypothetical protein